MLFNYPTLNFDILHSVSNDRYADGNDIRLVNLAPIASFSSYQVTTSSGKHLENISPAHIVFLMYKLIMSTKDSDDLSVGFE